MSSVSYEHFEAFCKLGHFKLVSKISRKMFEIRAGIVVSCLGMIS